MKVYCIGGYSEVGKNMTAVEVNNSIIILDMGLYLPSILDYEEADPRDLTTRQLINIGAIPDDKELLKKKGKIKAIILGHCHLDHIGAAPYLANNYNCPIIGTPYTIEILKTLYEDKKLRPRNKLKKLNYNSSLQLNKDIKIEFINITHSTLQTVLVVLHTKEGIVVYANDFKLDNYPTIGQKPNYEKLRSFGKENVKLLILDSLYSNIERKTPSEKVAKELLKEVLLGTDNRDNAVIVTTFASHIARLKSIIEFGKKLGRKVVFLGRSLHKYVSTAESLGLVNFSKGVEVMGYKAMIKKKLREIEKEGRNNYLIVCTGNQGEPESVLAGMVKKEIPFEFLPNDHVIFSCRTIPTEKTIRNREIIEKKLKKFGVRIFKDIHASGHGSLEDQRDLINYLKPEHVIPSHGDHKKVQGLIELATTELDYKEGKTVHLMSDHKILNIG